MPPRKSVGRGGVTTPLAPPPSSPAVKAQAKAIEDFRWMRGRDGYVTDNATARGKQTEFCKMPVVTTESREQASVPHYNDKYQLLASISTVGKIDDMRRIPKSTWHIIWNELPPLTRWAIVEDVFKDVLLVDVPTTMRDDLARTYMGTYHTFKDQDAAVMFGMMRLDMPSLPVESNL